MKVLLVVGARPGFTRAASVFCALRNVYWEVQMQTGQQHDPEMRGDYLFTGP